MSMNELYKAVSDGDERAVRRLVLSGRFSVNHQFKNTDSFVPDPCGPLHIAAANDNICMVESLLMMGADPVKPCGRGLTALHIACKEGHDDIVRILSRYPQILNKKAPAAFGGRPIEIAICNEFARCVQALCEAGADLRWKTSEGDTLLHIVFQELEDVVMIAEIVRLLLKYGAKIDAKNQKGETPFFLAIQKGSAEAVRQFLDRGISPNESNPTGLSPLYVASQLGLEEVVDLLLERGALVNEGCSANGNTPLHIAACTGHAGVVRQLLLKGADANSHNTGEVGGLLALLAPAHLTPLHLAVSNNHLGVAAHLLKNGASINIGDNGLRTPLHYASTFRSGEMMHLLLMLSQNEALTNKPDLWMQTPLQLACELGNVEPARALVEHGADPKFTVIQDGENALEVAAKENSVGVIRVLEKYFNDKEKNDAFSSAIVYKSYGAAQLFLEMGANTNYVSRDSTVLGWACKEGNVVSVAFLLENGANVDVGEAGDTPLITATKLDKPDIVKTLLEFGANVQASDSKGCTALMHACPKGCSEIIMLLLEYGAATDLVCQHQDSSLLACLYQQYSKEIELVDIFEQYSIKMSKFINVLELKEFESYSRDLKRLIKRRRDKYSEACSAELAKLQTLPGNMAFSYYDILQQKSQVLLDTVVSAHFDNSSPWKQLEREYPFYGRLIRARYQAGKKYLLQQNEHKRKH